MTPRPLSREIERRARHFERRRLLRHLHRPVYQRYQDLLPVVFSREGEFLVREIVGPVTALLAALAPGAVFTLDSAAEMRWGRRLVSEGDVWTYIDDPQIVSWVKNAPEDILRPIEPRWVLPPLPSPPRLLCVSPDRDVPCEEIPSGRRVVTLRRLKEEYLGLLGWRWDLLAPLAEWVERETVTPPRA